MAYCGFGNLGSCFLFACSWKYSCAKFSIVVFLSLYVLFPLPLPSFLFPLPSNVLFLPIAGMFTLVLQAHELFNSRCGCYRRFPNYRRGLSITVAPTDIDLTPRLVTKSKRAGSISSSVAKSMKTECNN